MKKQAAKSEPPLPDGAKSGPQDLSETVAESVPEGVKVHRFVVKILASRLLRIAEGTAPPGSFELARLAAMLLPEEEKRAIASGDLWGLYYEDNCFEENRALDNAFAAATYLFSRAVLELSVEKTRLEKIEERERENSVPLRDAAKKITSENRAGRAMAKLEAFVLRIYGDEEAKKRLEVWQRDGIGPMELLALRAEYKKNR